MAVRFVFKFHYCHVSEIKVQLSHYRRNHISEKKFKFYFSKNNMLFLFLKRGIGGKEICFQISLKQILWFKNKSFKFIVWDLKFQISLPSLPRFRNNILFFLLKIKISLPSSKNSLFCILKFKILSWTFRFNGFSKILLKKRHLIIRKTIQKNYWKKTKIDFTLLSEHRVYIIAINFR